MMSMRHILLLLLLSMQRCFSSAPLSLVQRHVSTIYYFGTSISPRIIPWYNSKTNTNIQLLIINTAGTVTFAAVIRETISYLNLLLDNLKQNNSHDNPIIYQGVSDNKTLYLEAREFKSTYFINNI